MTITVAPVRGRRETGEFIRFPRRLHAASPWYVPPLDLERRAFLDPAKNPFFRHAEAELFLARDAAGRTVGRISAHVDRAWDEAHGAGTGFFGFFDAADDPATAAALLAAAEGWLRARGIRRALGPMSFTTNHEIGVLVDGFEGTPCLMMPWNPPGYDALVRGCGYAKERDVYAYLVPVNDAPPAFLTRIANRVRRSARITVRPLAIGRFREELDLVKGIYNAAWSENWGFVPMTDAEIEHMAKELKPLLVPELVLFVFVEGKPAGFFMGAPDYNQVLHRMGGRLFPFGIVRFLLGRRKIDKLRVLTMGVVAEFRHLGLEALMIEVAYHAGIRGRYRDGEISWILEENGPMNAIARRIGGDPYRTYRVYAKAL